jgi:hypothetical protein
MACLCCRAAANGAHKHEDDESLLENGGAEAARLPSPKGSDQAEAVPPIEEDWEKPFWTRLVASPLSRCVCTSASVDAAFLLKAAPCAQRAPHDTVQYAHHHARAPPRHHA